MLRKTLQYHAGINFTRIFMGISIWQLLIVLAIILLLFGTKRLRNLGGDLGSAIKGFKKAVDDDKNDEQSSKRVQEKEESIVDAEVKEESSHKER